ncbi:MAG: hypothetical protein Q9224_005845 [Gallowayella concinna]
MSHIIQAPSSILYQSKGRDVTLIDIPLSISLAQGTPDHPCTDQLYSSPPLEKCYPSMEPRNLKAKEKVEEHLSYHHLAPSSFLHEWLVHGLAELRAEFPHAFCFMRRTAFAKPGLRSKVQAKGETLEPIAENPAESEMKVPGSDFKFGRWREPQGPSTLFSPASSNASEVPRATEVMNRVINNPSAQPILVHVAESDRHYRIPPFATLMLSKLGQREASHFSRMATKIFPEPSLSAAPGQFDFILLDPPWDNKSVRRSKTYGTRSTADEDPIQVLQEMLGKHMAPGALVACWITNKSSVREVALQTFDIWGVELVEEWAWLKTTVHGEPVCDLDGRMRRPYETLLMGRTANVTFDGFDNATATQCTTKRLIVSVPDIHSRKPCLKEIIEPMMRDRTNYRALEVFARNLTAGWWSWGDEVLKYNWEGYWTKAAAPDNTGCQVGSEKGARSPMEVEVV